MGSGLLPPETWAPVFAPLAGLRVGIVDCPGNAGDRMIHAATRQLASLYGLKWQTFVPWADPPGDLDVLLLFGGGTMGTPYPSGAALRRAALSTGVPCEVLPNSWMGPVDLAPFRRIFARDPVSLQWAPQAVLSHDLALGWDCPPPAGPPVHRRGLFLRRDRERCRAFARRGRDPALRAWLPSDYVELAAQFETIITDRLHFAIAGLLARRQVTLLPGSYFKNRSVWEHSLARLGCRWSDRPPY